MAEPVRLEAEIDRTARDVERSYDEALRKMRKLKDKLNALEQTISQTSGSEAPDRMKVLNSATESLSELSNSLIIRSKRAWQTCNRLTRKCEASGLDLARLDSLRDLCTKTEGMAADYLCYTLGHLRHRANHSP